MSAGDATETGALTAAEDAAGHDHLDLGHLGSSLGFLLRIAQIEAFEMFHEGLERDGIKPGEFTVLYVIERNGGIRQGVLARHLRIKRAHMAKLLRHLEERKLVSRRVPEDDRRAAEVTLTSAGRALVALYSDTVLEQARREAARLDPDEAETLIRLLRKFTGMEDAQ